MSDTLADTLAELLREDQDPVGERSRQIVLELAALPPEKIHPLALEKLKHLVRVLQRLRELH